MITDNIIQLKKVTKIINKKIILDNISIDLFPGNIYGLRGKNGCGKTMLMRSMVGFMKPTKGEIYVGNQRLYYDIDFPPSIGAMIEQPSFLEEYTGFENLCMLQSLYKIIDVKSVEEALKRVGLEDRKNIKYKKYSLGMKQKLGIAFAMLDKPDIIILDEPINALDETSIGIIRNSLIDLKNDRIIVIACHDREEMDSLADIVFLMNEGKIIEVEEH